MTEHEEAVAVQRHRHNTFSNPRTFRCRILRRAEGVSIGIYYNPWSTNSRYCSILLEPLQHHQPPKGEQRFQHHVAPHG